MRCFASHNQGPTQRPPTRRALTMVSLPLTQQLGRAVASTLKDNVAIPCSKAWVGEFIVESIVVTCLEEGVPSDVDTAMSSYQALFVDHLDDVEDSDVRDFCSALLRRLGELLDTGSGSEEGGDEAQGGCMMCERSMPLTKHHLIPRDVHSQYRKKGHTAEQLNQGVMICRPCHSAIHRTYDNKTLAADYASLPALMQSEDLLRFIGWVKKQRVSHADVPTHQRRYRR